MNFLPGKPIESAVASQLELRQRLMEATGMSDSENLRHYYIEYQQAVPWVKLCSGVKIALERITDIPATDPIEAAKIDLRSRLGLTPVNVTSAQAKQSKYSSNELAKRNVLFNFLDQGVDTLPGYEYTQLGYRPRPGISNMEIYSHNRFGSLRTSSIRFQCWSKEQLDELELLYMRPGYSILLEWGKSRYVKYNQNRQGSAIEAGTVDLTLEEEFFNLNEIAKDNPTKLTQRILQLKKDYGYHYDAIYGKVKNFSFSLRPDGGYDCIVSIITSGELIESFKANFFFSQQELDNLRTEEVSSFNENKAPQEQFVGIDLGFIGNNNQKLFIPDNQAALNTTATTCNAKAAKINSKLGELFDLLDEDADEKEFKEDIKVVGSVPGQIWGKVSYTTKSNTKSYRNLTEPLPLALVKPVAVNGYYYFAVPIIKESSYSSTESPKGDTAKPSIDNTREVLQALAAVSNGNLIIPDLGSDAATRTTLGATYGQPVNNFYINDSNGDPSVFPYDLTVPRRMEWFPDDFEAYRGVKVKELTPLGSPTNRAVKQTVSDTGEVLATLIELDFTYYPHRFFVVGIKTEYIETSTQDTNTQTEPTGEADNSTSSVTESDFQDSRLHFNLNQELKSRYVKKYLTNESVKPEDKTLKFSDLFKFRDIVAPTTLEGIAQVPGIGQGGAEFRTRYGQLLGGSLGNNEAGDAKIVYVKLGLLLGIINKGLLHSLQDSEADTLFSFQTVSTFPPGVPLTEQNRQEQKYFTFKNHLSVDPFICLLPHSLSSTFGIVDPWVSTLENSNTILDIHLNIEYILQTLSNNIARDGKVFLLDFLQQIFDDIKRSCGDVNELELQYDEDTRTFSVVDRRQLDKNQKTFPTLSIFGKNSIVKDVTLVSKLTPKMSSMIAISAQDSPFTSTQEATGFNKLNIGLRDNIFSAKADTAYQKAQGAITAEEKLKAQESLIEDMSYVKVMLKSFFHSRVILSRIRETVQGHYANFVSQTLGVTNSPEYNFILPFELSLTLDGVAGIKVMESFQIDQNILPYSYGGRPNAPIAFLVTGVQHTVSKQGWYTTIKAQIYNIGKSLHNVEAASPQLIANTTVATAAADTARGLPADVTPTFTSPTRKKLIELYGWPIDVVESNNTYTARVTSSNNGRNVYSISDSYKNQYLKAFTYAPADGSVPPILFTNLHSALHTPLRTVLSTVENQQLLKYLSIDASAYARDTTNAPGTLSGHSWGVSMDINADKFPYGNDGFKAYQDALSNTSSANHNYAKVVKIFVDSGLFNWGGNFSGNKDTHHFTIKAAGNI